MLTLYNGERAFGCRRRRRITYGRQRNALSRDEMDKVTEDSVSRKLVNMLMNHRVL
jgi:hypothetical protein